MEDEEFENQAAAVLPERELMSLLNPALDVLPLPAAQRAGGAGGSGEESAASEDRHEQIGRSDPSGLADIAD